jgi:hypothetical protein
MKRRGILVLLWIVVLLLASECGIIRAQSNGPPQISILWPDSNAVLRTFLYIKIEANATSPSGSISQVQFLAQTNVIGVVTNAPFNLVWSIGVGITNPIYDRLVLSAVATDTAGLTTTSAPVTVYMTDGRPPSPFLRITSPQNGSVFAAPATFLVGAELLASVGDTGPEEFFLGTNSVGVVNTNGRNETFTVSTPSFSTAVSNLVEGSYQLSVQYLGSDGAYCPCQPINIRVVKLAALSPNIGPDGRFGFEIVTSFPGKQNVIEVSTNLVNWIPIATNQPSTTTFTFTDPVQSTGSARFYRARVPAD